MDDYLDNSKKQEYLEHEVIRLREQISINEVKLKEYEETINHSDSWNLPSNHFKDEYTNDELLNIMNNQAVIIVHQRLN